MRSRTFSSCFSCLFGLVSQRAAIVLAVAALAALPLAASAQSPAAGTWELQMDFQGTPVTATMVITEDAGKLDGTWTTPRGTSEFDSVAFENGKLVAKWKRDIQGQMVELSYEGTIAGDAITGQMVSPRGPAPASGKRVGAAAVASSTTTSASTVAKSANLGGGPAVGTWKVTSVSQLGSLERTLVVKPDNTGTYATADATFPLANVATDGNHLKFDVTMSVQGQELVLHFEGDVDGDKIAGKFSNPDAGGELATVTGTRQ